MDSSTLLNLQTEITALQKELKSLKQQILYPKIFIFPKDITVEPKEEYFSLPPTIPTEAREVFLYISKRTGWCQGCDLAFEVKIYTQHEGFILSQAKFAYNQYEQNAWAYNSENIWLTISPERKVYVKGGNINIEIMGYKL